MGELTRIKNGRKSLMVRIVIVMILLVIPLNIWGIITASEVQYLLYQESENNLSAIGSLAMNDLDGRMGATDNYLYDTLLTENSYFQIVKEQKGDGSFFHAVYNLHSEMYDQTISQTNADVYFLYSAEVEYCDVISGSVDSALAVQLKEEIRKWVDSDKYETKRKWFLMDISGEQWLVRCSSQKTLYYGALIRVQDILNTVSESLDYETLDLTMEDSEDTAEVDSVSGYAFAVCSSDKADVSLSLGVKKTEIARNLPLYRRIGQVISISFLCIIPLIILFLYFYFLKPVKVLLGAMEKVQQGTLTYQIEEKANSNEFSELYEHFNAMVNTQVRMGAEIVEKETYGKRMELQTLQLQIRPHFLLNSFNLLYGMVSMGKIESAQKMILYLSDYFRYIFRNGRELELYSGELKMIANYIEVAKMRYPFIAFEETHDEEVLQVKVPPLLIHSFVENVLKHGQNVSSITRIRLTASYEDGQARFVVEDDGRGMETYEVEAINSRNYLDKDHVNHVGMKNADQRIRYFFGEDSGITVESVLGEGTKVTILLHTELGGEEDRNDSIDS